MQKLYFLTIFMYILLVAAKRGRYEKGANIEATDEDGFTPLIEGCIKS